MIDGDGRCTRSDLPPEQCAHCRGASDIEPVETVRWFIARYHSNCDGCNKRIRPSDHAATDDTGTYCESCGSAT